MSTDGLIGRAGRAAAWTTASKWIEVIGGALTLLVTARFIPAADFGVFGMALLAVLIPDTVLGGPLSESLIQRKDLRQGHLNGAFVLHLVLAVIFAAVMFFIPPFVADYFDEDRVATILPALSAAVLIGALSSVPCAILMRELRFKVIAFSDALSGLAAAVVGITLAISGFGLWALVGLESARRVVKMLVLVFGARWMPGFTFVLQDLRDLARFNLATLCLRSLTQADLAAPRFFVAAFLGAEALGHLNIAYRVFQQLSALVLAPFTALALPVASAIQGDRERLHATLAAATRASTFIAYPARIGAAAITPFALPLLLGEQWLPAVVPAQLLLIAALKSPSASLNGGVLRGADKPGLHLAMITTGFLIAVAMTSYAATVSLSAVCLAMLLRGLIQWIMGALLVRHAVGYPAIQQFIVGWRSLLASTVMAGAVVGARFLLPESVEGWSLVIVSIALGALVYAAALCALAPQMLHLLCRLLEAGFKRDRIALATLIREV